MLIVENGTEIRVFVNHSIKLAFCKIASEAYLLHTLAYMRLFWQFSNRVHEFLFIEIIWNSTYDFLSMYSKASFTRLRHEN